MRQHHQDGFVPALRNLQFTRKRSDVHDLTRVPDRHLDKRARRNRPQVHGRLGNGAVKPELKGLVGCELLVGQVGVVVAVQARHLKLTGHRAKVQLAQGKRCAAGSKHAVVGYVLPGIDVRPHPLVVRNRHTGAGGQSVPRGTVGRILKRVVPCGRSAARNVG